MSQLINMNVITDSYMNGDKPDGARTHATRLVNDINNLHNNVKKNSNEVPDALLAQVVRKRNGLLDIDANNEVKVKTNCIDIPTGKPMAVGEYMSKKLNSITPSGQNIPFNTYTGIITDVLKQTFYDQDDYIEPGTLVPVENIGGNRFATTYMQPYLITDATQGIEQDLYKGGMVPNVNRNANIVQGFFNRSCMTWVSAFGWDVMEEMQAKENSYFPINIQLEKSNLHYQSYKLKRQRILIDGVSSQNEAGIATLTSVNFPNGNVIEDTTTITTSLNSLGYNEFIAKITQIAKTALNQVNYQQNLFVKFTKFIIPVQEEIDLKANYLNNQFGTSAMKSRFDIMLETLRSVLRSPNLEIVGLPDLHKDKNVLGKNIYMLYNNHPQTLSVIEPISYTLGVVGAESNGFNFSQYGIARFSGVVAKKPQNIYYATSTVSL